jgi:hypothetical protein
MLGNVGPACLENLERRVRKCVKRMLTKMSYRVSILEML